MSMSSQNRSLYFVIPAAAIFISSIFGIFFGDVESQNSTSNTLDSKTKDSKLYVLLSSLKEEYHTGDSITLDGKVSDKIDKNRDLNVSVIIEAFSGDKQIYKSFAKADIFGNFEHTFDPSSSEDLVITAKASANATVPDAILTVPISSPIDTFAIAVIIGFIIGPIAGFIFIPFRLRAVSIGIAILLLAMGLVFLHYTSINDTLRTALSTVLFVPVGTYIFDFINKRSQEESSHEASVGLYRNDNLKEEVTALIKIYEEICQHHSILKTDINDLTARLSTKNYQQQTIVGTMANLPGLRINQYYRFVNLYNTCLDYLAGRKGGISDFDKFNCLFKDFKKAYADLETILYVIIIYNIAEIHHKFLSFPTVRLPMRISRPLYWQLLSSNALEGKVNSHDIEFVKPSDDNKNIKFSKYDTSNLIIFRRTLRFDKYYKNEAEVGVQSSEDFNANTPLKDVWNEAIDVYELFRKIDKNDLYSDGIAYKFMTYLGKEFRKKYENLEEKAAVLGLLDLQAYNQYEYVFNNRSNSIILQGNSTKGTKNLTFRIVSKPNHGMLSPVKRTPIDGYSRVDYTTNPANPGYIGEDSFTFTVTDDIIESEAAKVTLQVIHE